MSEVPSGEQAFLENAVRRLAWFVLLPVPLGVVVVAWLWGIPHAVGFAVGGTLAYLNYRWIVAVVDALLQARRSRIPRRVYLKLFAPVGLLAVFLYVMFSRSLLAPVAVVAGLALLVVGILLEVVYELILFVPRR